MVHQHTAVIVAIALLALQLHSRAVSDSPVGTKDDVLPERVSLLQLADTGGLCVCWVVGGGGGAL